MPLAKTLERVENEIASGNLAAARDRLLGLLSTFPSDLGLRGRLGAVYWRLGDPPMAGRYWYLAGTPSDEVRAAVAAFERSCGGRPDEILRKLKFRGSLAAIAGTDARRKLEALGFHERAAERRVSSGAHRSPGVRATLVGYGCMVLLALCAILAVVGLVTVLRLLGR